MNTKIKIKQGDVFYVKNWHGKSRPVLIIQNNAGNKHSGTVIVVPITSQDKKYLPTHYRNSFGIATFETIATIKKEELGDRLGHISPCRWQQPLKVSLNIT